MVATKTAQTLQRGDVVAIGRDVYHIRTLARLHEASVRLTFQSGETILVRRETKLSFLEHRPLPPAPTKRKRGRPPK